LFVIPAIHHCYIIFLLKEKLMLHSAQWPYVPVLERLLLAVALGVFVGLEREWRGKEAGIRTFGFVALLGCIGVLMGKEYSLLALAMVGILVIFLNWQRIHTNHTAELTTSVALLVTGFNGALCGLGHTFAPAVIGIGTASLLAWKESLTEFSTGLTEQEVRSAILLAVIAFIVYPILPVQPLDPWGLIAPRVAWATVILIAAIGFVNYVLWKIFGTRGMEISGFLGGLVNSTVAVAELAARTREVGVGLVGTAYRGIILANSAMLIRNGVILGILALSTLIYVTFPLVMMLLAGVFMLWWHKNHDHEEINKELTLEIKSPFSLWAAIKFGLIFVALEASGTLAQRYLGSFGFYVISILGGVVSSASAVASAAILAAHSNITPAVAANGAILASIASGLIDPVLVSRVADSKTLTRRLTITLIIVSVVGIAAAAMQLWSWDIFRYIP
jgi:uncharacterized membrane protein (DUF4010 family)